MAQWNNLLPLSFLLLGLSSSHHCHMMCGPLVHLVVKKKIHHVSYHAMRLIGYLSLALVLMLVGRATFKNFERPLIFFSGLILFLGFLFQGLKLLNILKMSGPGIYERFLHRLMGRSLRGDENLAPMMTGFLSSFLPCGVLYSVLLSALLFERPLPILFSILAFFLGTLPGLVGGVVVIQKLKGRWNSAFKKMAGGVLVITSVLILCLRVIPALTSPNGGIGHCPHCHETR